MPPLLPEGLLPLPIDPVLPVLLSGLLAHGNAVLVAPPGAGKTTRVPQALLSHFPTSPQGDIVVLAPRRLACHLSALRVADELGEPLGHTVGVQLRFDSVVSRHTRLRFMTLGVLLRQLQNDPLLSSVRVVVFDEFHERAFQADLLLALLRRLQQKDRPDLHLLVMSATLAAPKIAEFLGFCPVFDHPGQTFPVEIAYLPLPNDEPLPVAVRRAVRTELLQSGVGTAKERNDLLVFLPGSAEIRRCQTALQELGASFSLEIVPLHGDLPLATQRQAVAPRPLHAPRRVILTTNVAETSLTVDGVACVIDSGLAQKPGLSAAALLPSLRTVPICRAQATQRAGRAGRTQQGRCVRLYTKHDHDLRPEFETPELLRMELSEPLLILAALSLGPDDVPFFDPLPTVAVNQAKWLLQALGAIGDPGQGLTLTPFGKNMARLPLHPRLAALLLFGAQTGVLSEAAKACALLGERELFRTNRALSFETQTHKTAERSDLVYRIDCLDRAAKANCSAHALAQDDLDAETTRRVLRVSERLWALAQPFANRMAAVDRDTALEKAILAAFPDRVARRKDRLSDQNRTELLLAAGGAAVLSEQSHVQKPEWLVLVVAEERGGQTLARQVSAIEPDWLLDLAHVAGLLVENNSLVWHAERVEQTSKLCFGKLVLHENRSVALPSNEATALLAAQARDHLSDLFPDVEQLSALRARWDLLHAMGKGLGLPQVEPAPQLDDLLSAALGSVCEGRTRFSELRGQSLTWAVLSTLCQQGPLSPQAAKRLLDELFPESLRLPGGRLARIVYLPGQTPYLASRLQDFFGLTQGPTIARGKLALLLHLLAPNQRAVQVTQDLAGFWTRHYPALRKELARKYPKHAWPEKPDAGA